MTTGVEISIDAYCPRGFGLARHNKGYVEVAHAIPGDRVKVEIRRRSRRVQKGRLIEILEPSKDRVCPRCAHATICGGCSWQSMSYSAQISHKQKSIESAFKDLLHSSVEVRSIIACETPWEYRNKMEFSFSENRAQTKFLGLMIAHAEPYVFDLHECHIAPRWMSECLARVRNWWATSQIPAYYPPEDRGALRYLTLRETTRTKQKMVILNISGNSLFSMTPHQLEAFVQSVNLDASIYVRIHQLCKGTPTQFVEHHLAGPTSMVERMQLSHGVFEFKISPSSFFQPNTLQAEKLYNLVSSLLDDKDSLVFDLYCGTGTLGLSAARRAKKVIGIDLNAESIADAEENARRNGIENAQFFSGDVGKVWTRLLSEPTYQKPDVVIVDPPRAGLDERAIHQVGVFRPKKIIYVSCNPLTQANDIRQLTAFGYQLRVMQAVDQFPHTAHIENVAWLSQTL